MAKARKIVSEILKAERSRNGRIIVLTGARQVGKTSIVKAKMADYRYLSIEDPVLRSTYSSLTADQWHRLYPKAALDEVQKEPVLIESIKSAYDQFDDCRYVLLGSSQLLLLDKVKESLAGRCRIFDIYPLTLPEIATDNWDDNVRDSLWQMILKGERSSDIILPSFLIDPLHSEKSECWNYLLKFGGYPALVDSRQDDSERFAWLNDYVRTYLERDIRDLASFRDLEPFIKLQHETALLTGQVLNSSSIAVNLQVSAKTVRRYLTYLELSYQTILLPAWSRNAEKRLTKAPKLHFMDYGVQQAVLNKRGGMNGHEFESLIASELYKQARNILSDAEFYHLRTSDGMEVDLLVDTTDGYYAFEIKMAERVSATDARHLARLGPILEKPLLGSFILSNDPETKILGKDVVAVNATMFLG